MEKKPEDYVNIEISRTEAAIIVKALPLVEMPPRAGEKIMAFCRRLDAAFAPKTDKPKQKKK